MNCEVCGSLVPERAWYSHPCFLARRANIWAVSAEDYVGGAGSEPPCLIEIAGVEILRCWTAQYASFKGPAILSCARIAERFGFARFAIPSCTAAALDFARWCNSRGYALTVFVPPEERPRTERSLRSARAVAVHEVAGGWPALYSAFWAFVEEQGGVYPLYPSGDPWYLPSLRESVGRVLQTFPDRPIVLPCASGLHLLAYLEERASMGLGNPLLGVQLTGFDPLVEVHVSRATDGGNCPIPSMMSEAPVNARRIRAALDRSTSAAVTSVSYASVQPPAESLKATVCDHLGVVDESLFPCIEAARAWDVRGPIVLSTARYSSDDDA